MLKGHVFERQLFGNPIFAVFVNTFLAGENGIINGFGDGMAVSANGFDLTIQSGVCCIQGRFLQEDTSSTITAGNTPSYARLVLEIDLDKVNTEADFQQAYYKIITSPSSYPVPTTTDIVNNVSGIYQFPLGKFQITSNGIANYVDERTYLDFTSIYGEISEHIGAIDNEKIFLPIGGGCDFFGSELPNENFMWADGSEISRSDYAGLFAIIGTTYGEGDGSTTFNLPDKREAVTGMFKEGSDLFGTLGDFAGSNTQVLTKDQLPAIRGRMAMHAGADSTNIAQVSGDFIPALTNRSKYRDGGESHTGSNSIGIVDLNVGNNEPHSIVQKTLVCNYIIRVK